LEELPHEPRRLIASAIATISTIVRPFPMTKGYIAHMT
jgi:hypothetical protein